MNRLLEHPHLLIGRPDSSLSVFVYRFAAYNLYLLQEVIQTYTQVQPAASYVQETVYRAPVPSPTAPQPAGATVYYGSCY